MVNAVMISTLECCTTSFVYCT